MTITRFSLKRSDEPWPWARLTLDVVFFTVAAIFVFLAPCGPWKNHVAGVTMWQNEDPGGFYVVSSLFYVGIDRYPAFVGHPGLPLQLMIGLLARAMYFVHCLTGKHVPFLTYCAHHLRALFIMAGLLIAALHVVSFHALYAAAKRILNDAGTAFLAVLAYATLFPTLYFATRVSVEPLLVTFVLWTFLCLWKMRERLDERATGNACWWAALAALAATAALFTKFHLSAPLIPLALLQILVQRGSRAATADRLRCRVPRLLPATSFVASTAIAILLFSLKFDWRSFFNIWFQWTPGGKRFTATENLAGDYASNAPAMAKTTWAYFLKHCTSYTTFFGPTPQSLFTIAEGLFVILAVAGLVWFWRSRPEKRSMLFWPMLFGLSIAPVLAYRGLWHYFFLHLAFGSIFAAFCIRQLLARFRPHLSPRTAVAIAAWTILLIHSVSIVFFVRSKLYDASKYRKARNPCEESLGRLRLLRDADKPRGGTTTRPTTRSTTRPSRPQILHREGSSGA